MKKKENKERRFCKKRKWKIEGNWKRAKGETFGNKKMREGKMMRKELRQKEEEKIKRSMRWKFLERDRESFSQLYYYTVRIKPPKK